MNLRRKLVLATAAAGLARAGSAWAQAPARVGRIAWDHQHPVWHLAPARRLCRGDARARLDRGNVTGLGGLAFGVMAKQLDLLKQAVPRAQRIGLAMKPGFRFPRPRASGVGSCGTTAGLAAAAGAIAFARGACAGVCGAGT